ncbi:hypothetical protein PQX77_018108 [Marasmius sp. AFHP31]|nr:hypothetical protein PQX77_018108 [Marasmius sp. AFHP31]
MPMQSTFFPNARDFVISHSSFSHVEGDQHNTHNIQISGMSAGAAIPESSRCTSITQGTTVMTIHGNQLNQVIQQAEKEPTEFDDFRIVKRGDICRDQDLVQFVPEDYRCRRWYTQDCECDFCQRQVIKTVCIGKIEGTQGKFTVMSYSGPGGRKAFEKDFRKFSSVVSSGVPQMYAVDIGSIPSILYWNELVPAALLKGKLGWMGQMYLFSLRWIWKCKVEELWMDSARGVICCGPEGPYPYLPYSRLEIEDMPSTVDLLQEDVCLRFMASCKSKQVDHKFVAGIGSAGSDVVVPESFDQPTVISALTQTPIAVGNHFWKSIGCLVERKVLGSGLTRFRVVGGAWFAVWWNENMKEAWLCRALGVFHARGIGLDDDLSVYRLVWRTAKLEGYPSHDQIHCQRRSQQPIYLFLHPPPPNQLNGNTSSLHFWSSHEDGQKPFPPDICNDLGLPTTLRYWDHGYKSFSWPTKSYKQLDEYQRLRGFDPTTTDFARHLGFKASIFHPVNDTDRFDEDYEEPSLEPLEPHSNTDHPDLSATEHLAIQQGNISKKLDTVLLDSKDEPTSPNLATKRRRMGGGEGKIERRVHAEQNLHHKNYGTCNEQSVSNLSLRTTHLLPRRTLSSEELYPLQYDSARLANCASNVDSLLVQHYAHVNPHQNYPLPGLPASLPSTSTSFIPLPANTITTSSAAFHTGIPPRAYPEIPQYGMATLSSRDESFQLAPEQSTYRAGAEATNNAFPSSASTIPNSVFAQPGNDSTHASQTTGWPGVLPLGTSMNNHHWTSPSVLPNDLSIPPHTPPVGYPTNLGVHVHEPYPAVLQGHHSFTPYQGDRTLLPDEHWNVPATQLELQPVSSGPYADPSVYEQLTSSNESHSLSPPTVPNDISISPYPSAVGHPINHSEISQTVNHPSHTMSFNTIDSAPIHDTVPTAGSTKHNSSVDEHGAPHPFGESKYVSLEGQSASIPQHQQRSTVLSHPHSHPMAGTSQYKPVNTEAGVSKGAVGGAEVKDDENGLFRLLWSQIWVVIALLFMWYVTSRDDEDLVII